MSSKVANINKRGENKNRSRQLDHHHSFKGKKKNKKFWFLFFIFNCFPSRPATKESRPATRPAQKEKEELRIH
jgi:hypothetical protein